jgi:hypothetical protein
LLLLLLLLLLFFFFFFFFLFLLFFFGRFSSLYLFLSPLPLASIIISHSPIIYLSIPLESVHVLDRNSACGKAGGKKLARADRPQGNEVSRARAIDRWILDERQLAEFLSGS